MRSGHGTHLLGFGDSDKSAEFFNVVPIGASCPWVVDVGEPFELSRHFRQSMKFGTREHARRGGTD